MSVKLFQAKVTRAEKSMAVLMEDFLQKAVKGKIYQKHEIKISTGRVTGYLHVKSSIAKKVSMKFNIEWSNQSGIYNLYSVGDISDTPDENNFTAMAMVAGEMDVTEQLFKTYDPLFRDVDLELTTIMLEKDLIFRLRLLVKPKIMMQTARQVLKEATDGNIYDVSSGDIIMSVESLKQAIKTKDMGKIGEIWDSANNDRAQFSSGYVDLTITEEDGGLDLVVPTSKPVTKDRVPIVKSKNYNLEDQNSGEIYRVKGQLILDNVSLQDATDDYGDAGAAIDEMGLDFNDIMILTHEG